MISLAQVARVALVVMADIHHYTDSLKAVLMEQAVVAVVEVQADLVL